MNHTHRAKLTPYQAIFYYEWLQNPERSDYNIVIDNTGVGKFDVEQGNNAMAKLMNDHFVLNSRIVNEDGRLYWELNDPIATPIRYFPRSLTDQELYDLVSTPFDLNNDQLLRLYIINLGNNRFRQVIVVSHILVDGISTHEVRNKWSILYNNEPYEKEVEPIGKQIELHEKLTAFFEQNLISHQEKIHDFWKNRLKDISGVELDFLKSAKTGSSHIPAVRLVSEYTFSYSEDTYARIKNLKYAYRITPYIFGQMVLAILLHRISGKDKLALAYPVAVLEGQELIYGAHVNTMIIDYRFDEHKTLNHLIEASLRFYKDLKASKARYLPVYDITKYADNAGVLNIGFAQTFFRDYGLGFNGIEDERVNHEYQIDLVNELLFEQEDHEGSLNFRVRYYADTLDSGLVQQFLGFYRKLFEELLDDLTCNNGDRLIDGIQLLTENEQESLVNSLNSKTDLSVISKTVVELFEERSEKTPDNIAVVFRDRQMTYKELNERSNTLAGFLKDEYKVQADDLIALFLGKSDLMPVAILAVLKAGGAYMPVDPGMPGDRILYMLEDTCPKVMLAESDIDGKYPVTVLNIGDQGLMARISENYPPENPVSKPCLSGLAYVIYTSGSTGRPKGVLLEHRGLTNLSLVQGEAFGLKNGFEKGIRKKCLWYASYIFDAHVSELFTALANGHCLHILEEDKRLDFKLLSEYISENKIDIATIPPVLLDKNNLLDLSTLVVAGEVTDPEIMDRYRKQGCTVINAYGPTEGTVCSSLHYYETGDKNTTIGRPLTNTTSYILDADMRPVPVGVIGELYIGGAGIARGYINNIPLTQERFMDNPFRTGQERAWNYNGLLYKTGDLVRLLPSGDIEYNGRNDFQVKIRGFRIEPGEIENRISGFPGIERAVVIPRENASGTKYLAAYYQSAAEQDHDAVREHLLKTLPDYMIPSYLVHLTAFPVTINGKLDRKALPEPVVITGKGYVAPGNELEQSLCTIYAQVLGTGDKNIGITDDFFQLGGDSISSIQLAGRIRQQLKIRIDVKDILNLRTIRELALKLQENKQVNNEILTEQGLLEGTSRLLPVQKWFFSNVDQGVFRSYNHWNQTFILDVPLLDVDILKQSIRKLSEYHDALRLSYRRNADGTYTQYYRKTLDCLPFTAVDASVLTENDEKGILTGWQQGFDIFSSPLFHVGYLRYNGSARLHFAFHHLVIDTISWHIIRNDLYAIYQYLLNHPDISLNQVLGAKNTSYRQWVNTVWEYKVPANDMKYWQDIIEKIPGTNRSLQQLEESEDIRIDAVMDPEYTGKLLKNIHHVYNTQVNDILLTALGYALKDLTGSNTHCVTLEGHGRGHISGQVDINRTVGWFTCMYPVEIRIEEGEPARNVAAVKDMLHAVPGKGLGYGATFGYTDHEMPGIGFNYLGQFDGNVTENEWSFSPAYPGPAVGDGNRDVNRLSINCGIAGNQLHLSVIGSLDAECLSSFTGNYIWQVKNIIDALSVRERGYLTLSDTDNIISYGHLSAIQSEKEIEGVYMANSLQQGFIYHSISQGHMDDAYRTQMMWDYHCSLDTGILKQAWAFAQKKYPSLRLRFSWEDEIIQVIDKEGTLNWEYMDISGKNAGEQDDFVNHLLSVDRQTAYDLQKGSLFRLYVIKREDRLYNCIFSSHHAILDGWSNPVLIKYAHDAYLNLLHHQPVENEQDKVYGISQKYLWDHRDENRSYWDGYLKNLDSQEDLSALLIPEKKNINLSGYRLIRQWGSKKLKISNHEYTDLKRFASAHGITLNSLLQYCWHKQLGIYTASDTTVVGMVVSGRNLPVENIEQSVGLFINTLPVICRHDSDIPVMDLVRALQDVISEGNRRSNINLSQLQAEGNRLFNSLFVFENYPMPENIPDNELSVHFKDIREKQDYPLVISIFDTGSQLVLNLQYADELFEDSMMEQVMEGIFFLLAQVTAHPDVKSSGLSCLDPVTYNRVVIGWNDYRVPYPADRTVTDLFEEQVERAPEKLAVRFNDIELSYRELNEKANQLAAYLKHRYEIYPDDLVGLYLDRSAYMLVSILAVLKTGAAYLPADPAMPGSRVSYMFSDAKVKCVLTNEKYRDVISGLEYKTPVETVDCAETLAQLTGFPVTNMVSEASSQNLAYVMYTSGTTGIPKGVMIEHRHISRLVYNSNYVTIQADDHLLSLSAYQFDGSTYDFFAALLNGASVTISTRDIFLDLARFNDLLEEYNITNFFVTTALFNMIVDAGLPNLGRIRYLLFGGEQVSVSHVNRFRELYLQVNLVHVYGPTEATTYAAGYLTNSHLKEFIHQVPAMSSMPMHSRCTM